MKKVFLLTLAAWLLLPMGIFGQTYQQWWNRVEEAQQKDLPQTAMKHLQEIEKKAAAERAYGQLLKASLLHARLQAEVAPDSMAPAVKRIEQQTAGTTDIPLRAIYNAVLSKIYDTNPPFAGDRQEADVKSRHYRECALEHPEALAAVKAGDYAPFIVRGKDSELFDHDLLSVVGWELEAWELLGRYYEKAGNRAAACRLALWYLDDANEESNTTKPSESAYLHALDSLIERYGDLPDACEIAIARYDYMDDNVHFTPKEKKDWILQSLQRWGTWPGANELRNDLKALTQPNYHVSIVGDRKVQEVNKPTTFLSEMRNVQSFTMRVFRTKLHGDTMLDPGAEADYRKMKQGLTEVKSLARTLKFTGDKAHPDYEVFEDSLELGGLPAGVYMLEFSTKPQTEVSRMLYYVSGLRVLSEAQPDNRVRFVIVDATTGQPVPKATLQLMPRNGDGKAGKAVTLTADERGEVICNRQEQPWNGYRAYTSADQAMPMDYFYDRYNYYARKYDAEHTSLFTDRSIYRPGQTVHVAAIVWKEVSALENKAVEGKSVKMELRDANYKLIGEKTVTTDRFGKCTADFTLPVGLLNGRFTIRANGNNTSVRVEEYKRPTFRVEFDDYKKPYQNGDTIQLSAKAVTYAGVPVQGARVKYTVRRQMAFWWLSYSRYWQGGSFGDGMANEILAEGETTTADDGTFRVSMPMALPKNSGDRPMFYHFVAEADVTDTAGETHSGTASLPLGTKPTALTCDLPRQVRSDLLPRVTFQRRNAAGQEIAGTVSYRIDGGEWQQGEANNPLSLFSGSMASGEHRLEAVCEADTVSQQFVVFGLADTTPASDTRDWFYVSHSQFPADGQPVTVQVGSSDPDLYIVYGIFAGARMIESGAVKKNAALINRKFTYKEEYGNGLLLTFAWMKNGHCYSHQQLISRPMPDRKLKLSWETFRDRLTPGQQEEWRLKILNPDATPAAAQLMAVLYDKSLDQIQSHQWSFSPIVSLAQPTTNWLWSVWGGGSCRGAQKYTKLPEPSVAYSHFDNAVLPVYHRFGFGRGRLISLAAAPMAEAKATNRSAAVMYDVAEEMSSADDSALEEVVVVGYGTMKKADMTGSVVKKEETKPVEETSVRENLAETAFFYPSLETDAEGRVALRFTLPESLTSWRFMGVSNTENMCYGTIEGEAVAQKDVMVQPNVPRFVRQGDKATLTTRIFNISDHAVSGTVRLQLLNPETNKTVVEQSQPFSVEAGKTGVATFEVHCSALGDVSLLVCKVMATGEGFSDGEQHYLPVLPNREMVIRTIPFTQNKPGTKTVDLTKLIPAGTTQQKLTVEYTNNPAWLMVQSLPTVGQPWEQSAIEQAAAYYSNRLAQTILKQNPQVKTTFELWKQEKGQEQTLMSQLQKDVELKDLLLNETPWVASADREAEQKQRLADFFDENGIEHRLEGNVEKLKKLQNTDGSFSWYPGMPGSTMVTAAVAEMMARLNLMAGEQQTVKQMHTNAFSYLGKEMVKLVDEMKQAEKKGTKQNFPTFTALRWLYVCALDGRALPSDVRAANNYLIALLKKDILNQSIYEKALSAVILSKQGEKQKAAEYVRSLKEWSVYNEELGRYYDTPRAGYSWFDYKIPTEVAAIEAIKSVGDDELTIDEMRRWLLQEKRTQAWDTPINSVNAIYAFFFDNQQSLGTQEQTVLAIDGKKLELPKATAGLGYVKTVVSQPKAKKLTAKKTSTGTSWGTVYAQYMQPGSKVDASGSGITIRREILKGHQNSALSTDDTPLKVGDRIMVRLIIETTRDLDFVQVVDRRAACMAPINQLSGYRNGAYCSPKDNATHYFYYGLGKGKHVVETEYYIDRAGSYETGTCTVGCAYAPEYRATAPAIKLTVE